MRIWPGALLALLMLVAGCGDGEEEEVKVFDLSLEVARVDDTVLTLADLNRQIAGNGWVEHTGFKRVKDTAEFNLKSADDLIIDVLLTRRAQTHSIDTVPDIQRRIRDHMRMFVLRKMYDETIVEEVEISPEEVDTFYNNNREKFFNPAGANVAQILVTTNPAYYIVEGQDRKDISKDSVDILARKKMAKILDELEDGESFEDLAKEYSDDQNSGQKGGLLGWLKKGETPPAFDSTMWAIPIGMVSPAIKTVHGYHLLKVYERVDSSYTPLDNALRAHIKSQLAAATSARMAREYLDSLRQDMDITYNEKLLKQPDSTYESGDWLVVIEGIDTIYATEYVDYGITYQKRNRLAKMEVDDKKKALDRFVPAHILEIQARKLGYYDREEAIKELADFTLLQAKHHYRLKGEIGGYRPTDEEVKEYYEAHLDKYNAEKPLHVQHILFEDSSKAEEIRREIEDGADFREMALKYYPGDEEIRESLFDLGYISKEEMPVEFWNAAWILSEGNVSRPVRTEYGFHIIKLIDRKPTMSLEDAQAEVRRDIIDEKKQQVKESWRQEILAGHDIEIDSALVREFVYQRGAGKKAPVADTTLQEASSGSSD